MANHGSRLSLFAALSHEARRIFRAICSALSNERAAYKRALERHEDRIENPDYSGAFGPHPWRFGA